MANLARVKEWNDDEILTHTDLNAEFDNILNNASALVSSISALTITNDPGVLIIDNSDTSINDTDQIGRIDFQAYVGDGTGVGSTQNINARFHVVADDVTGATEDATVTLQSIIAGTLTDHIVFGAAATNITGTLGVSGVLTASAGLVGDVTGNASGTALTVTQAAQPAITSVGTLTTLTVDNLTINGNTITADSGALNLTPAAGSAIVLDGTINVDAGVVTGATSITSTAFVGDITGDVTGNTSGTALTVTQAAQPNITSLGTLTTLTVDNLTINGNTITADTGALNLTPASGSAIVLDGTISVDAGVVTGATSITSTAFVGTLSTAAQTNITSVGTLTSLAVTGEITGAGFTGTLDGILGGGTPAAATVTTLGISGAVSGTSVHDDDSMATASSTTLQTSESIKAYVDANGGSMPKGHIFGGILVPGTDAANDINSTAIECRDAADTTDMTLAAFVKQIDVDWATGTGNGGFPSGLTLTDETWYHFFIVSKTGDATFDAGFDTSLTASNLLSDTGGTLYRRIGSVWRRVSSNGNKGFTMFADGKVMFDYGGEDGLDFVNTALSTSARETVTLTSPTGIKLEAIVRATWIATGGAANQGVLTSLDMDDIVAASAGSNMADASDGVSNSKSSARINVWTNTSSQIGFRMDGNASMDGYATCVGYYDDRGRNS